ncbi:hypothetical protein IJT10_04215 [bacterium]|nr:hypothetical protein [bacterium]
MGKLLAEWDDLYRDEKIEIFAGVLANIKCMTGYLPNDSDVRQALFGLTASAYNYAQRRCTCDGRSIYAHYSDLSKDVQDTIDHGIAVMILRAIEESDSDTDDGIDWLDLVDNGLETVQMIGDFGDVISDIIDIFLD